MKYLSVFVICVYVHFFHVRLDCNAVNTTQIKMVNGYLYERCWCSCVMFLMRKKEVEKQSICVNSIA